MASKDIIVAERQFLVSTLRGLSDKQWCGATLCAGWTVEDLAAHLIVRERGGLIARAGIVLPFLHHKHDQAIERTKHKNHDELIRILEKPPVWVKYLPFNLIEFYVHNEDLLRGELARPRVISDELEAALSGFIPSLLGLAFRRVRGGFSLVVHDESLDRTHHKIIGASQANMPELELSGGSGELVLLFLGRGKQARVRVAGSKEARRLYEVADVGL